MLLLSPKQLAWAGIVRDPFGTRPGDWRCTKCNTGLQNGLSGAREHHQHVHLGLTPHLYVVA